jgi:hypothetical protein
MAITTLDQLVDALANNSSRIVLDKANLANQLAGVYCSLWRATGQPAQGAIPTAAAMCTNELTGAIQFAQQVDPATSYIALLNAVGSNSAYTLEIHDRLAHMGGLVLNSTALQTTNLPLDLEALSVPANRIGSADFGDVQTWLDVYGDGGATASNATINVTFDDNTTANLNTQAVGGTIRIGRRYSVDALRTTAQQGKNIKRINSVQLSASTGTAGNFGFTFTRPRMYLSMSLAHHTNKATWTDTGLAEVPNGSCLQFMILPSTTSSGTLRGGGKIVHG